PGNQTALNTRAAPFAAYIARMHRNIHELWGFGFLNDLDGKPDTHPLNNRDLMAKLEIVLNGDGTVDKVTVVRPSGLVMFDAQAAAARAATTAAAGGPWVAKPARSPPSTRRPPARPRARPRSSWPAPTIPARRRRPRSGSTLTRVAT